MESDTAVIQKGKIVHLIETLPVSPYDNDAIFIALTPEAVYGLTKDNIPFFTLDDDFLPFKTVLKQGFSYSKIFQAWIDSLDEALMRKSEVFSTLSIRPATLYGYYLQLLIDPFILKGLSISKMLEALEPKEIVFWYYNNKEKPVDYQLKLEGCSIAYLVAEFLCKEYGITLSKRKFPDVKGYIKKQRYNISLPCKAKRLYKEIVRFFLQLRHPLKKGSMLILFDGWGISRIEKEFLKNGYVSIRKFTKYKWDDDNTSSKIKLSDLGVDMSVFDNFVGFNISKLFYDRVRFFAEEVCGNLERAIAHYLDLFKKEKIKFIFTPYKMNFDDFAVMSAATSSKDTVAIQVLHGYSAIETSLWKFTEQPCDLLLTPDREIGEYFSRTIINGSNTKIEMLPIWTKKYKYNRFADMQLKRSSNNTILYIPSPLLVHESKRRFDIAEYPDTWYFRYQMELLEYFASEKKLKFIYKAFPADIPVSDIIQKVINSGKDNIIYATGHLYKYLLKSGRVIVDTPSTPLYEAVLMRIPTLCLYYEGIRIRESAKDRFREILQPFSTISEAIEKIRCFLNSDRENYVRETEEREYNIFETINRHKK